MNVHAFRNDAPLRHRFTVDDVAAMAETGVIAPDAAVELLDGELIDMPVEGVLHLSWKDELVRVLAAALGREWRIIPDGTLHLSLEDAPTPDFYVVAREAPLKPVGAAAVPLVIEISDTTLSHDLGRKAEKYAQYGLPEYWVIDVKGRQTHVLTAPRNGAYHGLVAAPFETPLTPAGLPDMTVRLADVEPV